MKRYILVLFWFGFIISLSSIPGKSLPSIISIIPDFVYHFIEYFILAFLIEKALKKPVRLTKRLAVLFIIAALALVDEWHQKWIPHRFFSLNDLAADVGGAAIVMGWFYISTRYKNPKFLSTPNF